MLVVYPQLQKERSLFQNYSTFHSISFNPPKKTLPFSFFWFFFFQNKVAVQLVQKSGLHGQKLPLDQGLPFPFYAQRNEDENPPSI